jgi:hypothetical protein
MAPALPAAQPAVRAARKVFPEDVVVDDSRGDMAGIVSRVGGQSDEEESDLESDDNMELEEGSATVRWLTTNKTEVEQVGSLQVQLSALTVCPDCLSRLFALTICPGCAP